MPRRRSKSDAALSALRRIARDGQVSAAQVRATHPNLYADLLREFRTFSEARRRAGLAPPSPRRVWSLRRVILELRELHRAGVRTSVPGLRAEGRADLATAAATYAGGIQRARRLAGLPEPALNRTTVEQAWDASRVVAAIQALHDEGKSIAFSRVEGKLRTAARRHCGSYREAVEAAGFDYGETRLMSPALEQRQLIEELRRLRDLQPWLTRGELGRHSLARSLRRRFGTMDEALRKAGIRGWPAAQRQQGLLSRAAVVREIRRRRVAGASVSVRSVSADDLRLYRSAVWHFGDWPSAVAASGATPRRRVWSEDSILGALRSRHQSGRSLAVASLRLEDNGLRLAAERRFGSVGRAARRAGIR